MPTKPSVDPVEDSEDDWKDDEDHNVGGNSGRRGRAPVKRKVSNTKFPPRHVSI